MIADPDDELSNPRTKKQTFGYPKRSMGPIEGKYQSQDKINKADYNN